MRPADPSPHQGPLVIHPGALGDLVRMTAVTRFLARRWKAPCDLMARHGAAAEVVAGLDSVRQVFQIPSRGRPFWGAPGQWRTVAALRRRRPGPVYLFEERLRRRVPWRDETRLEWLLRRAGVDPGWCVVARHDPRRPLEEFVEYGLRVAALDPPRAAAPAEGAPAAPRPELHVSEAERQDLAAWLAARDLGGRPCVLFQVTSRSRERGRWSRRHWRGLARRILETAPETRILLLGTAEERTVTAPLAASCADPRVLDVAGEMPLRRLFALAAEAHSCVSLDTGPAHAVAALGCPLVVLIGRADPRRNAPRGPGPARQVAAWPESAWPASPHEWVARHDVAEIPGASVFDAWREVVAASKGSRPG